MTHFYLCLDDLKREARNLALDYRWKADHPGEDPEDFLADATPLYLSQHNYDEDGCGDATWSADQDVATAFDTLEAALKVAGITAIHPCDRVWIEDDNGKEVHLVQQGMEGQPGAEHYPALLKAARAALQALNWIERTPLKGVEGHKDSYSVGSALQKAIEDAEEEIL